MTESGDKSEPRPTTDTDDDTVGKTGNPDLHGAAKEVEEKRAKGDPETTGA